MVAEGSGLLLVAAIHGLAGRASELRALLGDHAAEVRLAPGATSCRAMQDVADPAEFVLLTGWSDEAAMHAHFASPAYARYAAAVGPMLTRPSDVEIHSVASTTRPTADASLEPGRQG
jgi:quinol monooxygenase YgiN